MAGVDRGGKVHERLHEQSNLMKKKLANKILAKQKGLDDVEATYNPTITEYSKQMA